MNPLAEKLQKSLITDKNSLIKLNQVLPPVALILLIIACSYLLSQITWSLIPGDESTSMAPVNTQPQFRPKQQTNNYNQISDAHLFGAFQQDTSQPIKTDAPDTRLNLVLKGVLAATPMKLASVIIAIGKNGNEDIYSVGDKVSSATVKEIHADRVILQRSGRFETLRMPKDFNDKLIKSTTGSRGKSSTRSSAGAVLSDVRKQIIKNPTSFTQFATPVPVKENGKLRGYKLRPNGNRALFDQVGLDPNDVIIAINGVELNNPGKSMKAIRKLQSAKELDITVLRNGAEVPLHFAIP